MSIQTTTVFWFGSLIRFKRYNKAKISSNNEPCRVCVWKYVKNEFLKYIWHTNPWKKIFLTKMKKVQIFSSRPRPAWGRPWPASRPASGLFSGRPQAGLGPASIFEEFGNCLSVKCKKWFLRKIESVYKKSGLTKIEIMFLKYHITKRKVIWLHIRFGFQISNFRQAGPRPA